MSKRLLYSEVVRGSSSEDEGDSQRYLERTGGIVNCWEEYQNVDEQVALKEVLEISKVRFV